MTERLTETYPCNKCKMEFCSRLCYRMTRWAEIAKEQLEKYENVEEEGRLLFLPCKIKDTVWVVTRPINVFEDIEYDEDAQDELYEAYVSSITFYENSNQYRICAKETNQFIKAYFRECDFGKTVFLSKKEAEKALEEMKKNNAAN